MYFFKEHKGLICFVSRCDFPADSSSDLPNSGRHPGFLHGPGTYTWDGGAGVHCGKSSWTCDVCACVFCVWPWASVDGLQQLGVPRLVALSHLANLNTHTPTHTHSHTNNQTNTLWTMSRFSAKWLFFCHGELFWLPFFVFFLTARWTTCYASLLVPWVPALSLRLRQWQGNRKSIQRHEGSWYTLCKFSHNFECLTSALEQHHTRLLNALLWQKIVLSAWSGDYGRKFTRVSTPWSFLIFKEFCKTSRCALGHYPAAV